MIRVIHWLLYEHKGESFNSYWELGKFTGEACYLLRVLKDYNFSRDIKFMWHNLLCINSKAQSERRRVNTRTNPGEYANIYFYCFLEEIGVANTTVRTNISLSQYGFRLYHLYELLVWGTMYESIVYNYSFNYSPETEEKEREKKCFLVKFGGKYQTIWSLRVLKPVQECMSKHPKNK